MPEVEKITMHSSQAFPSNDDDDENGVSSVHCHQPDVPGALIVALCYANYGYIILIGHLRDALGRLLRRSRYYYPTTPGYAPLFKSWENFYTRRLYHRIQDCWNRPIAGSPGAHVDLVCRKTNDGMK